MLFDTSFRGQCARKRTSVQTQSAWAQNTIYHKERYSGSPIEDKNAQDLCKALPVACHTFLFVAPWLCNPQLEAKAWRIATARAAVSRTSALASRLAASATLAAIRAMPTARTTMPNLCKGQLRGSCKALMCCLQKQFPTQSVLANSSLMQNGHAI